jgi:dimethylargininase
MFAITRKVPSTFATAICASVPATPIDVERARQQHAAYCVALSRLGVDVITLDADDGLPDCCFVEDTAVVAGGIGLVTNPGAASRSGEVRDVALALENLVRVVRMRAPATLDGGDCMRVGKTIYVGRSARTNAAGIEALARSFPSFRVISIDLPPGVLHLKCVCAPLDDERITLVESMPRELFRGVDVVLVPESESYAANVLAIRRNVLVPEGFPRTAEAIARAGLEPIPIATSEFRKADGALTCLSILL